MFTRINDSPVPYNQNMFKSVNEAYMPQMSKSSGKMLMWVLLTLLVVGGIVMCVSLSKKKNPKKMALVY